MKTRLARLFLRAPKPVIAAWYLGRRYRHEGVALDPKAQLVAWIVRQFRTEDVGYDGQARGEVDGLQACADQGQGEESDKSRDAADICEHQGSDCQGRDDQQTLRHDEQLPAVKAVCQSAAV